MSKILVTGDAGIIGSHVIDLFLKKDYEERLEKSVAYCRESKGTA